VSALCSSMTSYDVADKKRGLKTLFDVELSMTWRAMSDPPPPSPASWVKHVGLRAR